MLTNVETIVVVETTLEVLKDLIEEELGGLEDVVVRGSEVIGLLVVTTLVITVVETLDVGETYVLDVTTVVWPLLPVDVLVVELIDPERETVLLDVDTIVEVIGTLEVALVVTGALEDELIVEVIRVVETLVV